MPADGKELEGFIASWTSTTQALQLAAVTISELPNAKTIKSGSTFVIALKHNENGNITGVEFTQQSPTTASQLATQSLGIVGSNSVAGARLKPSDLAPIVCFTVDIVSGTNGDVGKF